MTRTEAMQKELRAANKGAETNEKALQLAIDERRSVRGELEKLRAGVEAYRHHCRTACEARSRKFPCNAYQVRGLRCPECPLDDAEEMDAQIEHAGAELPQGEAMQKELRAEESIDAENEPEDCPHCDGVGDLPGNPNTNSFPTCPHCRGSGKELDG